MKKRTTILLTLLLGLFSVTVFAERPNIILCMTDDQGYGDMACHGNTVINTPNIDALYAESVRLTNFHVSPVCTPTRSALMTGNYPERNGSFRTTSGRSMMHADEITIADLFSDDGYVTGMMAKWHLGDNAPHRPQDRGFQDVVWHHGGGVGQAPDYWYNDYFDDTYERNGTLEVFDGYCTDVWVAEAMRFVSDNQEEPFFLYLAPNAPHSPFYVGSEWSDPYEAGVRWKGGAEFYGMIENFDYNLGLLRDHLDTLGLTDNTILIFMTDNGSSNGYGGVTETGELLGEEDYKGYRADMRGQKGTLWEGGHRVPFFIYWPDGGLTGGRDLDHLAAHIDVLPTLAELCSVSVSNAPAIDGISFAAQLPAGSTNSASRDHLVVQMMGGSNFSDPDSRVACVIQDQWRLIKEFDGTNDTVGFNEKLYDVSTDPAQTTDIASANPNIVQALSALYQPFWDSVSPRVTPVPIDLGNPVQDPTELCCFDWYMESGNPPWTRTAVQNRIQTNGLWNVDVKQAGSYRLTLRQRPSYLPTALVAVSAKIQIAGLELLADVAPGAQRIVFEMELPAGTTELKTWLYDDIGESSGAYFTEIMSIDAAIYNITTNWSSKTVNTNTSVTIRNGATVALDQSSEAESVRVNNDSSPISTLLIDQNVNLTINGSTGLEIGSGSGAGVVSQSMGTVSTGNLIVNSSGSGSLSQYNLSGGNVIAGMVSVNAAGEINLSGGNVTADFLTLNDGGVLNLTGGELFIDDGEISTAGLLDINGGTFKIDTAAATSFLYFGEGAPGGLIKLRSGSFLTTGGENIRTYMNIHVSGGTMDWAAGKSLTLNGSEFRVIGDGATITGGYFNPGQYDIGGSVYFEMGATGISTINAAIHSQLLYSPITVDGAAYTGGAAVFTLIDTPELKNVSPSITVTNFADGLTAEVNQNQTTHEVTLTITESSIPAGENNFNVAAGNWGDTNKWSLGRVPGTVEDEARILYGYTATVATNFTGLLPWTTIVQADSTLNIAADFLGGGILSVPSDSGEVGFVNQSAGDATMPFIYLGDSSGTASDSVYSLTGGELLVDDADISPSGVLDVNGGTLNINAIVSSLATLKFGDGKPGGLIKLRSGTLTKTGNATKNIRYYMDVHVSGGTVSHSGSIFMDNSEFRVIGDQASILFTKYNVGQYASIPGVTVFEMGVNGISTIIASEAQLQYSTMIVDGSAYTGSSATFTLIDVTNLVSVCPSVMVTNFPEGMTALVNQDQITDEVTLTITVDGYARWSSVHGLSGQDADLSEDPDRDGKNNLFEYASGSSPVLGADDTSSAADFPAFELVGNNVHYVYRRRRNADTLGLSYLLKTVTNLVSDEWSASGVTEIKTDIVDDDFEAVTNSIPVSDTGFFTLTVELNTVEE